MSNFDATSFYKSYPAKVIQRPGYPARAQYKSTLMWALFGKRLLQEAGHIASYADVGGCFGFGANAMAFHITQSQHSCPATKVFEIADDFIRLGRQLFPDIEFVHESFVNSEKPLPVFDLITMFDVIEHIENPMDFLTKAASRARFLLLKTPMETSGAWGNHEPLTKGGKDHPDGHVNFFTPDSYLDLLNRSGIEVIESKLVHTIIKPALNMVLNPEGMGTTGIKSRTLKSLLGSIARTIIDNDILPYKYFRFYWGSGDHLCLAKSKKFSS